LTPLKSLVSVVVMTVAVLDRVEVEDVLPHPANTILDITMMTTIEIPILYFMLLSLSIEIRFISGHRYCVVNQQYIDRG
jgi:hypothetical protein